MVQRKGISVVEVLFAIGIAAVGLLGVILLLPVALHSLGRGTVADRASRTSSNALSEIHARSILETSKWWWRNRGVSPTVVQYINASSNTDDLYRAFAIDPRFVAHNGLVDYNGPTYVGANLFPYVNPYSIPGLGSPRMERITLDTGLGAMMSAAIADQVFVSRDDLVFDVPADKTLPPTPQFGDGVRDTTTTPSRLGTQRQYQGDMSWMATVVPKYDESDAFNDEYILSIVIFNKRDPSFSINETNERVANVTAFPEGGLNGGGVTIQSTISADYLDLKAGNWVLLMSRPAPFTSSGLMGQQFRWYRVTDTEVEPRQISTSPNIWERDVTLDGPDWRPDIPTEIALINNVVHVLERTVRLGSTSLWMP